MSDDAGDRFSAFDAVDGGNDEDAADDSESEETAEPEPEPEPELEPVTETQPEPTTDESDEDDDAIAEPAFSYNDSNQSPIYARPESWEAFERTLTIDAEQILWEKDVQNIQKRELHDAALRLAAEQPERLVELALEARRES